MPLPDLRVVVTDRPPFVFVTSEEDHVHIYGLLVDLLNRIQAACNNTWTYTMYIASENAGGALTEAGWNGVVGELYYGRADVALFPLTRTAARLEAIDCTFSYLDQGIGLVALAEQHKPSPLSVLAPFETTLWVTLLCTVLGVGVIFWALDAYGRWIRARQLAALRASGAEYSADVSVAVEDERSPVLISFIAAAGAPESPGRPSWGLQASGPGWGGTAAIMVLYVFYCFFCLVVLSSYTANLTSLYLVWKTGETTISSLQRFSEDGTLSALRRAWSADLSQCGGSSGGGNGGGYGFELAHRRLSVTEMVGAFSLVLAGAVIAFAIGTVENLKWCLMRALAEAEAEADAVEEAAELAAQEAAEAAALAAAQTGLGCDLEAQVGG
ncbi:hypothetical protein GPECTOR_59g613 [Gonium pectorale]|uniref:Ionotropic glutamate receptor C-terminal domain-containing protein n=1 Tax=Gonium pectorale TaxID=33097 RepID=A0A150G551_GONPE|nr:hypothetical protein GPECTOR_59g613 [Gonium pectorale]|eukprot:KXZ45006.1 hypothetical protein GPECTOR_59g613 [Gonium pectorale]